MRTVSRIAPGIHSQPNNRQRPALACPTTKPPLDADKTSGFGAAAEGIAATALRQVEEWLDGEAVWVPSPIPRHGETLANLLRATGLRAEQVPDAHVAALALEHGLAVVSADTDFSRFPNVRLENPVV